ncbi:MAG: ABC transporter ATP-binding protein [Anaerovorax sp.]|nr:ABC transporter ATP-binding protein [Anaerovorax sp.]
MDIEIKGLCKHFGKNNLYKDFNLSFSEGKTTAIIGPSGCGKTTLLRILAGLEEYEAGSITGLPGKTIKNEGKIAFLFQEDRLLPWLTVSENISFVLDSFLQKNAQKIRVKDMLELVKMKDYAEAYPKELSGGMQRRVAIARTLAYDADLILMDEPFKGLDDTLKAEIQEKMQEQHKGIKKTILLVTHDLEDAQKMADIVYRFHSRPVEVIIEA